MDEFVGSSLVVFIGMFSVFCLAEGKVAFSGRFEQAHFMDFVLGEETSVVVTDVTVPACAVGAVVDDFAFGRYCFVGLHF